MSICQYYIPEILCESRLLELLALHQIANCCSMLETWAFTTWDRRRHRREIFRPTKPVLVPAHLSKEISPLDIHLHPLFTNPARLMLQASHAKKCHPRSQLKPVAICLKSCHLLLHTSLSPASFLNFSLLHWSFSSVYAHNATMIALWQTATED